MLMGDWRRYPVAPSPPVDVSAILERLAAAYSDAKCALVHSNPFELLVATILSAQSTDVRVNQVTARLFQEHRTPEDFAALEPAELEPYIKELGLFRSKAKHIVAAARTILAEHDGQVPT